MVATIPIDLCISFCIGIELALSARYQLRSEAKFVNPYFLRALLFQLLCFYPIGLIFAKYWTAWSWMYFINSDAHSPWWTFAVVTGYIPAMIVGHHLGYTFIRLGEIRTAKMYLALGYLGVAAFSLPILPRLIYVSDSFAAWQAGTAPAIWHISETWNFILYWIVVGVWYLVPFNYIKSVNKREGRRIKSEEEAIAGPDSPPAEEPAPAVA